ncbi:hypothetical protein IGI04_018767 [Brassica rapa subsp. trilocularis]|uniref:Extradiol ring-cleavage dioxygenase class III enzyme subunit B domain-containing protein n=1 Tax=Brassica rapa subsp. trilocularis TaxID=1813537 RepID=A0ABQ7MDY7_BRACM|nr:hypothetical protein IGI04_018767 [Brassica rapa subsp. trilocularis]
MERVNQTFFLSHGSPTLSIDDSLEARQFFKSWTNKVLPQKPKSILVISAHWDTKVPTVNTVLRNSTIHDFYGFPDPMYKLKYEAPGAIELGKRVKELLMGEGGMKRVDEDKNRGLDHGAWVPLMLMYPEADIPVCQLSVQSSQSGTYHYNMGKALAPLKDEGVLIIGSGSATHNLRKLDFNITNGSAVPWALAFDHWLRDSLLQGRYGDVNEWEEKAPNAKMAHPWPEHFYPLHVAMGAAGGDAKAEQIHTSWQLGTLLSIDDSLEARDFFKSWSHKVFQHKPKSILVISAHWDTEFPSVNTVLRNTTIHDFNGFPEPMYKLKYEAPGAIELGKRVKELLMVGGGMKRVDEDTNRGLDHGAWIPLMLMYPEADIPVCQLSVQSSQNGSYHYNMGKSLAPLKAEGVLIIGSGSATHNLSKRGYNVFTDSSVSWALEFDLWLRDSLLQGRYGDVNDWEEKAPNPRMAHPWPEHLYPLHVAMGAAGDDAKAEQIHTSWTSTLSYSSYRFTSSL